MVSMKELVAKAKMFFTKRFSVISEINRKYARPRIKMTRMVRWSLLLLRLYLIILLLILAYKFILIVQSR
jgi:hypothetical protein